MLIYGANNNKPIEIIVHHTAVRRGTSQLAPVNSYHEAQFSCLSSLSWYVGYHYFIDSDGTLTQTREDTDEGCHTIGQNTQSLGICLAGNFDIETPSAAQRNTLVTLLDRLTTRYNIAPAQIFPHRKFNPKSCYGYNLSDSWASDQLLSFRTNSVQNRLYVLVEQLQILVNKLFYAKKS